jgi:hypothetical protein
LSTPCVLASAGGTICPPRNHAQDGRREVGTTLTQG